MGEPQSASKASSCWSPAKRVLFRFLFAYLLLYVVFAWLATDLVPIDGPSNSIVGWVGKHVFGVELSAPAPGGSGDTIYHHVQLFCMLLFAVFVTTAWTLLDRGRPAYPRLYLGLRVVIRLALAMAMIAFGAMKVIPAQFGGLTLSSLIQPVGQTAPMKLLWTTMAASESYTVFTGAGELLAGLLLTARRTTLLGSLVCIAVMSNVVMLNFSYDVPVKLLSSHLLAMAIFLAAPDLPRLARLFLLNRTVEPAQLRPLFQRQRLQQSARLLWTLLVAAFTSLTLYSAHHARATWGDLAPRPPLYGVWDVEELELDGQVCPPVVTDPERWRRVIVDRSLGSIGFRASIQPMEGALQGFVLELDSDTQELNLKKLDDPNWKAGFSYQQSDPDLLRLEGTFDGRAVRAKLRRATTTDFVLVNRGFHWIQEQPFFR